METLFLEEGEGVVHFCELGLEGSMHAKTWPQKLDPQVGVRCCDGNISSKE
jgi:hypothetical protein